MNFVAPAQMDGAQGSPVDLRSILAAVLRRWKLITIIPLLTLIAAYGALGMVPSLYKSTLDILVFDPQRQIDDSVMKRISPIDVDTIAINTEMQVIKSKSVALGVVKELDLDRDEEFQPGSLLAVWLRRLGFRSQPADAGSVEDTPVDTAAETLRKHLDVERVQFSYVLTLSVTSQDPAKSQRLAAAVADVYLSSQREARLEALQRVATWLKDRLDELRSRILETEASIEKLKAVSGLSDTGGKGNVAEQQIAALNTQLTGARGEVAEKRASLDQARRASEKGDLQEIPAVMASAVIEKLRVQQLELSRREAELSSKVGERHAEVVTLRMQLANLNKAINEEADHILGKMKNDYDATVRHEQSLEANLQTLTAARGNSADYVKLQQLQRVVEADRKLYTNYSSQFNEVSTRQTLQDAGARIITPATLPLAPSYPRSMLILGFAGILGSVIALALAFLLEYLRVGIKTGAEVEQNFGYPVVGVIPLMQPKGLSRRGANERLTFAMTDAPLAEVSEAVGTMRLGLKLGNPDRAPKVVLVTSSVPGEGKSAAATLLAASSAAAGQRTLLMDCDLRHPSISEALGQKQRGLAEVLMGTAEVEDVTVEDPTTGTSVIPAGGAVRSPGDLLTSQRMLYLMAQLRERYDYIVIDTAPLLPVVDALALAGMADKILLIVEWSRTPRQTVAEAFKILRPQAARIAGIVLNKVDLKQLHSYGYYTGYYRRAAP